LFHLRKDSGDHSAVKTFPLQVFFRFPPASPAVAKQAQQAGTRFFQRSFIRQR